MKVVLAVLATVLVLAAPASAENRLDRAADALGSSPLYVHPELTYLLDERDRGLIVSHLREANVPYDVKVVALPSVEADESGGDLERALWAIDDKLFEAPRLLVGVGQRGNFAILQARLKRDIDVPFEIEYGPSGDDSPKTIVPRLRAVFQLAATAEARDYVYQRDRPTDPLDPLPEDRPPNADDDDDDDSGAPRWVVLVGAGVGGALTGALGWLISIAFRWGRRHA